MRPCPNRAAPSTEKLSSSCGIAGLSESQAHTMQPSSLSSDIAMNECAQLRSMQKDQNYEGAQLIRTPHFLEPYFALLELWLKCCQAHNSRLHPFRIARFASLLTRPTPTDTPLNHDDTSTRGRHTPNTTCATRPRRGTPPWLSGQLRATHRI